MAQCRSEKRKKKVPRNYSVPCKGPRVRHAKKACRACLGCRDRVLIRPGSLVYQIRVRSPGTDRLPCCWDNCSVILVRVRRVQPATACHGTRPPSTRAPGYEHNSTSSRSTNLPSTVPGLSCLPCPAPNPQDDQRRAEKKGEMKTDGDRNGWRAWPSGHLN